MSIQKLSAAQKQNFENEIMATLNSPRWFVLPSSFTDELPAPHTIGPAENRTKGLFDAAVKLQFEDELSHACSAGVWMVVYGTLSDDERLKTRIRCLNIEYDNRTHMILERFVFEAFKRDCAWTWRMPMKNGDEPNEGLFRHIAHGVYESLTSRAAINANGITLGRGDWRKMILDQMAPEDKAEMERQLEQPRPVMRPPPGKRRARPGWWKKK